MKSYTITVNGNVYDVTVEENGAEPRKAVPAPKAPAAPRKAAPAPKAPAAAPKAAGAAGGIKVEAGAAGKVFKVEASVGQKVSRDTVIILEAMKMEIPVVAPEDGTVASIDVAVGDAVEAGAVMATLN